MTASVWLGPGDGLQATQAAAVLADAGFEVGTFHSAQRTLLDTFDGRLHAAGIRLELCEGAGRFLIVSGGGPAVAQVAVDKTPSFAADLPAGAVRGRLAPVLDVRALLPKITLTAHMALAIRRNTAGKTVVSVALHDRLRHVGTDSGPATSWAWAAEVSAFEGYPRPATQTEDLLASLGLLRRDGSILEAMAADAGIELRGFVDAPTVSLDPREPAVGGFRRVLANLADTIDANWQGTVDDVDPEFLHDLRVAVRRTRSVLSHGKQVVAADGRDHFGAQFRWLGTITSPARDQDVYGIEWPSYVAPLDEVSVTDLVPVVDHLALRRAAERTTLARHLQSGRYRGLMTGWRSWLDAPVDEASMPRKAMRPLGPVVAARLVEAQDRLLARGRGIGPTTAAEVLHELRKDAKRLRYILECFGGLLPAASRKPFVQRLKSLQDNLGEHQDTEVHTAQLRAMAQDLLAKGAVTSETLVAMGRLTEIFEQRRQAARAEFTERFVAYDTKQTARALDELLDAARSK